MSKIPYHTLTITLFSKCTAKCEMCCFSCTPASSEILDKQKVFKLIREAGAIAHITTISFSGGEVFLEYAYLKECVTLAHEMGKQVTVITNCFWAVEYDKTREMLAELKANGLSRMSVSYDEYHQKYIKIERVKTVLEAARALEIPIAIGMIKNKNTDEGPIVSALGESVLNIPMYIYGCLPSGAAKAIDSDLFLRHMKKEDIKSCPHGGIVSVFFNGKTYPCCSQSVVETELIVGNFEEDTLEQMLKNIKSNGLLFILRNEGFPWFIQIAEQELGMELPESYVSPCELCSILFTKEHIHKFYPYVKNYLMKYNEEMMHAKRA